MPLFYQRHTKAFLVLSSEERYYIPLRGVRCLLEMDAEEALKQLLAIHTGDALAERWGVDENQISRLRAALGKGMVRGGNRRGGLPAGDDPPIHIQTLGDTRTRTLLISTKPRKGVLVHGCNIIVEAKVQPQVKAWLLRFTVRFCALNAGVDKKAIMALRLHFGVTGRVADAGSWKPKRRNKLVKIVG